MSSQVHQIARSFRDKWIPRTIRRIITDRDDGRIESQSNYYNRFSVSHRRRHDQSMRHSDAIDCISEATPAPILPNADSNPVDGTKKTRKRKSRWDQPGEMNVDPRTLDPVENQVSNLEVQSSSRHPCIHYASPNQFPNQTTEIHREINCSDDAEVEHISDDAPPGFSSPLKNHQVVPGASASNCSPQVPNSNCACEVVSGHSQKRYLPHLPVSYGIPLAFVQQLGTPKEEAGSGWAIAPGVPFHPFPPLPKYPRGQTEPPVQPSASTHKRMKHGMGDEVSQANINHMDPHIDSADTTTAVVMSQEAATTGENYPHMLEKGRLPPSDGLGRRYYRQ